MKAAVMGTTAGLCFLTGKTDWPLWFNRGGTSQLVAFRTGDGGKNWQAELLIKVGAFFFADGRFVTCYRQGASGSKCIVTAGTRAKRE